jgi:peptide subunit release factor 1 (eRF1)
VLDASRRVAIEAERAREAETVSRVENGAGPGGGAVTGAVETLTALQTGQVMKLVMNDDFSAPGWADYTLPMYGTGEPPATHPAGGSVENIVGVALEEEVVRLALQVGAEIEIIHSTVSTADLDGTRPLPDADANPPRLEAAQALDRLGGVGAILRYTLSEDQSTAEL